jgi:hypothetical protein
LRQAANVGAPRVGNGTPLFSPQRYMHLSPAALDAAIRLLETGTDTSRVAVEK